jgi:hypothetical protein
MQALTPQIITHILNWLGQWRRRLDNAKLGKEPDKGGKYEPNQDIEDTASHICVI